MPFNFPLARRLAYLISFVAISVHVSACAQTTVYGNTVSIGKTVPETVKTVKAPNMDPAHYRTLKNTQFSYRCYVPYVLKTGQAAVEVCEINPVKLQIINWPETEVIHLVSGHVTITHNDGSIHRYSAGDIFVLPEGFKGVWDQPEILSKVVVRHPLYWKE
ncbi:cupin domain-containing protein [Methylibium sp.]|uniref:cupin domain-containing protein n=1 Tax=Methylibium sp. TaxID=2067992 RepID=UPI003D0DFBF6